jgi:hypothetical protein
VDDRATPGSRRSQRFLTDEIAPLLGIPEPSPMPEGGGREDSSAGPARNAASTSPG